MYQSCSTPCIVFLNTLVVFRILLYHGKHVEAPWTLPSSPNQAVRLRALAGDIVLCSWATHFTLTVRLSTYVYKLVLVNFVLGVLNSAID